VAGVVIGHQQDFAQNRFAVTMRDRRKQVRRFICHHLRYSLKLDVKGLDSVTPSFFVRRSLCTWPAAPGEFRGDVPYAIRNPSLKARLRQ